MVNTVSEYSVNNLGDKINTAYPEYGPLITSDESKMLFTSRRPGGIGNLKDPNGDYFEDVYVGYFVVVCHVVFCVVEVECWV